MWLMPCTSHQMACNVVMIHISNHLVRMVTVELLILKGTFFFVISKKSVGHTLESYTLSMDNCAMRNIIQR